MSLGNTVSAPAAVAAFPRDCPVSPPVLSSSASSSSLFPLPRLPLLLHLLPSQWLSLCLWPRSTRPQRLKQFDKQQLGDGGGCEEQVHGRPRQCLQSYQVSLDSTKVPPPDMLLSVNNALDVMLPKIIFKMGQRWFQAKFKWQESAMIHKLLSNINRISRISSNVLDLILLVSKASEEGRRKTEKF